MIKNYYYYYLLLTINYLQVITHYLILSIQYICYLFHTIQLACGTTRHRAWDEWLSGRVGWMAGATS